MTEWSAPPYSRGPSAVRAEWNSSTSSWRSPPSSERTSSSSRRRKSLRFHPANSLLPKRNPSATPQPKFRGLRFMQRMLTPCLRPGEDPISSALGKVALGVHPVRLARKRLRNLLKLCPGITIAGECANGKEAATVVASNRRTMVAQRKTRRLSRRSPG